MAKQILTRHYLRTTHEETIVVVGATLAIRTKTSTLTTTSIPEATSEAEEISEAETAEVQ
jgi:hypothetical protein